MIPMVFLAIAVGTGMQGPATDRCAVCFWNQITIVTYLIIDTLKIVSEISDE
jgi:hypothetical protein